MFKAYSSLGKIGAVVDSSHQSVPDRIATASSLPARPVCIDTDIVGEKATLENDQGRSLRKKKMG